MEHEAGRASVDRISEAKLGDFLWVFDSQAPLYEDNKYVGRGVWKLSQVVGETRQSLLCYGMKFDRKTGDQRDLRGWLSSYSAAGEKDKEDRIWVDQYRWKIRTVVDGCRNADTLKKIADLLGWKP